MSEHSPRNPAPANDPPTQRRPPQNWPLGGILGPGVALLFIAAAITAVSGGPSDLFVLAFALLAFGLADSIGHGGARHPGPRLEVLMYILSAAATIVIALVVGHLIPAIGLLIVGALFLVRPTPRALRDALSGHNQFTPAD